MQQSDSPTPPDPVDALSQVQDDRDEALAAQYWAVDQILAGNAPEAIADELVVQGWHADKAAEIAEHARQQTRLQRGVVTREDIASHSNSKYRKSQRRAALLFRLLMLVLVIFIACLTAKVDFNQKPEPAEDQRPAVGEIIVRKDLPATNQIDAPGR